LLKTVKTKKIGEGTENNIVRDAQTILVVAKHNKKICLFTVRKKYALVREYMRKCREKISKEKYLAH